MTFQQICARLQARRNGSGWMARCPAHEDRKPSLSISEGDRGILLHCHAGCSVKSICAALEIEVSDLFFEPQAAPQIVAEYDYVDESGKLLFQVVRFDPKDFRQRRPDGTGGWIWHLTCTDECGCNPKLPPTRRVLYRLPEVLKAKSVLVVEGEKDVETARELGFDATCNPRGAGKWRQEYSESLRGKPVAIIADDDKPKHNRG